MKKWYKKKRYWIGISLFLLLLISRLEVFQMRYQPDELAQRITQTGQKTPIFKTKTVNGSTMQYLQIGIDNNLPFIVFVHGSPGALSAYEDYLIDTILSKKANLIAVDRLGFGYSDFGKTESNLAVQAQLIGEILKDLPATPKILVGHSMGGPVIAKTAMDYPTIVDGLLLIAPSISPEFEPSNIWRKVLNWWIFRWLTPTALRVCNQEIIPLKEELLAMESGWENIRMPVTVVQGTIDNLVPKENAYFAQQKLVNSPAVQLKMIEGGNHFILWSEVDLIKEALGDLLQQLD